MPPSRRGFMTGSLVSLTVGCSLGPRTVGAAADGPADVPWLSEVQQPPEQLPASAPRPGSLLVDDSGRRIETLAAWRKQREEIHRWWVGFLGRLDVERRPPKLTVLEEDRPAGVVRQLVRYENEPGRQAEGYLIRPRRLANGGAPGVVALHSTVGHTIRQPAGVEGNPAKAFGLKLAQEGCVTFSPRCFLWRGEGSYRERAAAFHRRHPQSRGMAKMLFDAQRGLDVLETAGGVDPKRLGAVGHSLGAKEALYLAAFDPRVKAAVSSEGGVSLRFSNWDAPWYLGDAINEPGFTREHHELLGLIAPRPFLLIGGGAADGAKSWPLIERALPVYRLHEPDRRPRLGLFDHGEGHSVPPIAERRIQQWLLTYL